MVYDGLLRDRVLRSALLWVDPQPCGPEQHRPEESFRCRYFFTLIGPQFGDDVREICDEFGQRRQGACWNPWVPMHKNRANLGLGGGMDLLARRFGRSGQRGHERTPRNSSHIV